MRGNKNAGFFFFIARTALKEHSSSAKLFPDTECVDSPWEQGQFTSSAWPYIP